MTTHGANEATHAAYFLAALAGDPNLAPGVASRLMAAASVLEWQDHHLAELRMRVMDLERAYAASGRWGLKALAAGAN